MTERRQHLDTLAVSLLLACCVFWGFQQILIKTTVGEVPPLWQASIRFVGATALLWLWCAVRGVKLFARDGTLRAGLLAGVLFAGEFSCIYLGLRDTTASRLTVFLYTSPFVVALLLPRLVPAERLRPIQWVGLVIAFAAVAVAFSEAFTGASTARQLRGDALALAAGVLWGLTTLVIRASTLARASAEKTLFYQVAVTAVAAPFISLALGETWSLTLLGVRVGVDRVADRDRRLRQLPRLDVDAAALPGDADVVLHLPHARVRAGVRRRAAQGAADAAAGARAVRRGRGDRAGESAARLKF